MATHSTKPFWPGETPWTEGGSRLQIMGSQRVRNTTEQLLLYYYVEYTERRKTQMYVLVHYKKMSTCVTILSSGNKPWPHLYENLTVPSPVTVYTLAFLYILTPKYTSLSTTVLLKFLILYKWVPVNAFFYVWLHSVNTLCILSMFCGSYDLYLLTAQCSSIFIIYHNSTSNPVLTDIWVTSYL